MAQTNYTPISLYYSTTASAVPTAANLVQGELAINTADGKLYYEDSSGVVQVLATKSTGSIGGSNTQVQFNNSGSLGGSSSFTWDGTTVTATKFAGALNGTVGATTASTGAFTTINASTSITNAGLTSGRVTYAGASGLLSDSSTLTYDGTSLTTPRLVLGGTTLPSAGTATLFSRTSDNNTYLQTGSGNNFNLLDGSQNTMATFSPTVLNFNISNSERMRLNSTGLGIGTSSPSSYSIYGNKLVVYGTGTNGPGITIATGTADTGTLFFADGTTGTETYRGSVGYAHSDDALLFGTSATERMRIDSSGNVLIGSTSVPTGVSQRVLQVTNGTNGIVVLGSGATLSPNPRIFGGDTYDLGLAAGTTTGKMVFYTNDTERMRIDSSGIVTMSAYGAGAATFSASGVISSVSDETWKTKDGVPTNTDAMLQKLEPGYWFYNEEKAPIFGQERQLGFYAQNVHEAIGEEAAPTPQEGKPWGYHDRSVLAIAVMSLKNALNTIEELKQRIETLENK